MNIFYLDTNHDRCAKMHCDKHVVKMVVEYAQLLSTAHRVLDGELYIDDSSGRKIKRWRHPDPTLESKLYKASFVNHPSAVWVRESRLNYRWLSNLWYQLCKEYEHRYGRMHKTFRRLTFYLDEIPTNINSHEVLTEIPQCMPEDVKAGNPVDAYQNYYIQYKKDFAKWTRRSTPEFMQEVAA